MNKFIICLGLFLSSLSALAATGTAGVETFYVRTETECPINGDGLSYECSTNGTTGAWSGEDAVSLTAGTGVDDGDTLKHCGDFAASDSDTATHMIFVASTHTAASESARITHTGDCSDEGGRSYATFTGGGAVVTGLAYSVSDYLTFEHIRFYSFTSGIANTCSPSSDPDAPIFNDIIMDDIGDAGMVFTGVNYRLIDVDITSAGEPLFVCNGVGSAATGTSIGLKVTQTDPTDADADGFQFEAGGGASTWINTTVVKWGEYKGCAILGSVSGKVIIDGFDCTCVGNRADVSGVAIDGSGADGYARNMNIKDCGGAAILLRATVTPFAGDFDVYSNVWSNTREGVAMSGAHAAGTIRIHHNSGHATEECIQATSTFNPLLAVIRNNALDCPTAVDIDSGVAAADIDIDYNTYGPNVVNWKWRGVTDTVFSEYQTESTKETNSTHTDDMVWVGGETAIGKGFCPGTNSPLIGTGQWLGAHVLDFNKRGFNITPNRGAFSNCRVSSRRPRILRIYE